MLVLLQDPNKPEEAPWEGVCAMKNLIPGQVNLAALGWLSQSRDGKGAEGDQAWRGRRKQPKEKGGWTISQRKQNQVQGSPKLLVAGTFLEETEIPLGLKKQPSLTRPKRTLPEKAGENPWVSTKMKSPTSGEAICISELSPPPSMLLPRGLWNLLFLQPGRLLLQDSQGFSFPHSSHYPIKEVFLTSPSKTALPVLSPSHPPLLFCTLVPA